MRAKFIYESLTDYLEPKSNEDIINDLSKLSSYQLRDSLLSSAANDKIDRVKMLIDAGANIESKSLSGLTPLLYAARYGHKDVAEILLKAGANINAEDNDGWNALHYAIHHKRKDLEILLKKYGAEE